MAYALHDATAAAYLLAALGGVLGLALRLRAPQVAATLLLALGAVLHAAAFWGMHALEPTPSLTEPPLAASLMAWLAVVFFLALLLRVRGLALSAIVAPGAFLGALAGALWLRVRVGGGEELHPALAHLHVLLASAGFGSLAVAGAAGALYLVHHKSIKEHRAAPHSVLPSLEALDRANGAALALGFTLLSLGVLSGVLWVLESEGRLWPGGLHANATLAAWALYAVVALLRFVRRESARRAALQSALGFGLLLVAVVGMRVLP